MLYMIFLVWLRSGSNPTDINQFGSHTEKYLIRITNTLPCMLTVSQPTKFFKICKQTIFFWPVITFVHNKIKSQYLFEQGT